MSYINDNRFRRLGNWLCWGYTRVWDGEIEATVETFAITLILWGGSLTYIKGNY